LDTFNSINKANFFKKHIVLCDTCFERIKSEGQALYHINRNGHCTFSTKNILRLSNNENN
jgi:hypothetical protein